jgi:hypothetical protein
MDQYISSQLNRWKTGIEYTDYKHKFIEIPKEDDIKEDNSEKEDDIIIEKDDDIEEKLIEPKIEVPNYGVCDNEEQFYRKYPKFMGYVTFSQINRTNCHDWRWHKWGDYIGDYDLSGMEYLYEADGRNGRPLIDIQYYFKIMSMRPLGH